MSELDRFPPVGTSAFWERYMALYDEGVATLQPYRQLVEEVAGQVLSLARPIAVLDAGCGTGNLSVHLAHSPRVTRVIAIDRNDHALRIARDKLHTGKREEPIDCRVYQADLDEDWTARPHGIQAGAVDAVVCVNALYTLAAPDVFIRRASSILRPGGYLVLSNPYVPEPERILHAHQQWVIDYATSEELREDASREGARRALLEANRLIAAAGRRHEQHFLQPEVLHDMLNRHRLRPIYTNRLAYAETNVTIVAVRE